MSSEYRGEVFETNVDRGALTVSNMVDRSGAPRWSGRTMKKTFAYLKAVSDGGQGCGTGMQPWLMGKTLPTDEGRRI